MQNNLTNGSVIKNLIRFAVPYLISCFLQTFYGLADLFITGQFNGTSTITAVSIGSQVTHFLTVIIVGLAMGATVAISRTVGKRQIQDAAVIIGNTALIFIVFSVAALVVLMTSTGSIISLLSTPAESVSEAYNYLFICFAGVPFITAYNVISSIFRGLGDSKTPMIVVFIAGIINVVLDIILIGPMQMGAAGAALATVIAQGISVIAGAVLLKKRMSDIRFSRHDLKPDKETIFSVLSVGIPTALQDGFIQIAFLAITVIVNHRGVTDAAAVGIVEKVISFLFLVPSAMLSSISAIASQNIGAGNHKRASETLKYGIIICLSFGFTVMMLCEIFTEPIIAMFDKNEEVIRLGGEYLRTYAADCFIAGVHFCFSGYFCAYRLAGLSFAHNVMSSLLIRVPGSYIASVMFPDTLWQMGLVAPIGSAFSAVVCIIFMIYLKKKNKLRT